MSVRNLIKALETVKDKEKEVVMYINLTGSKRPIRIMTECDSNIVLLETD